MHAVHSPWRGVEISSFSSPHVNMSISNHSTTRKRWRSDAPIILPGRECHTGGSRSKPTVHRCRPKTGGCGVCSQGLKMSPQKTTNCDLVIPPTVSYEDLSGFVPQPFSTVLPRASSTFRLHGVVRRLRGTACDGIASRTSYKTR